MPQKTVITKVNELGEDSGIRLHFPQNRVLYADQFTGHAPDTSEEMAVFQPSTIDDVFAHYRPSIEGIALSNEDGELCYETFKFDSVDDFDDEKLIAQSETLSNSVYKKETYYSIIRYLERNRNLRKVLNDPEAKKALVNAMKAMRTDLSSSK
jgi:hypothetical protein